LMIAELLFSAISTALQAAPCRSRQMKPTNPDTPPQLGQTKIVFLRFLSASVGKTIKSLMLQASLAAAFLPHQLSLMSPANQKTHPF